jgi:putative tryptophan/tyrosine transport system substrate-binding protein
MHRRQFLIGGGTLLAARLAGAQPSQRVRRIAILEQGNKAVRAAQWRVLEARLREHGYSEGRNLAIERRWADGVDARLPQLARELLAGNPEVVVAITTPAIQSLMRLTDTVPIVMTGSADPVATGLVASLARPGANVTGISLDLGGIVRKRLELMREVTPKSRRFGLLGPGANAGVQAALKQAQQAAEILGIEVRLVEAADAPTIAGAFERFSAEPVDALLVTQVMLQHHRQVVELAARHRLPAGYVDKEILPAGGLLVFGPERDAPYRHAADYVHRVLQGAKPAELPVMQPTEYWLGLNLKTAKALGIRIPPSVLLRADQVIE